MEQTSLCTMERAIRISSKNDLEIRSHNGLRKQSFRKLSFNVFFLFNKNDRSGVTPSAHTYTGFEIEIKRNQLLHL